MPAERYEMKVKVAYNSHSNDPVNELWYDLASKQYILLALFFITVIIF